MQNKIHAQSNPEYLLEDRRLRDVNPKVLVVVVFEILRSFQLSIDGLSSGAKLSEAILRSAIRQEYQFVCFGKF